MANNRIARFFQNEREEQPESAPAAQAPAGFVLRQLPPTLGCTPQQLADQQQIYSIAYQEALRAAGR